MPNLFEHLTSAPSIFIFGRRPKGSEAQPNFKLRSRLKLVQLTHERARIKLGWILSASEKEEDEVQTERKSKFTWLFPRCRNHVETEDRTVNKSFTVKGTQAILINESGLYVLILGPKLESVECQILWAEICEFGKIKMQ